MLNVLIENWTLSQKNCCTVFKIQTYFVKKSSYINLLVKCFKYNSPECFFICIWLLSMFLHRLWWTVGPGWTWSWHPNCPARPLGPLSWAGSHLFHPTERVFKRIARILKIILEGKSIVVILCTLVSGVGRVQGVSNRREIQLMWFDLPCDDTCFADGYSICIEIIRIGYCIRGNCTLDKYFLFTWSTVCKACILTPW